jgi:hypothetical protein
MSMDIAIGFPAQNSQTPAHLAAYGGGVSTLKVLIERGANLDIQDKVGLDSLLRIDVTTAKARVRFNIVRSCNANLM